MQQAVGMDQLSAHLDRGWDLLNRGDLRGARASARRAMEIDKESPEAFHLLGQVCQREGEADQALEHFRQAMSLDDGYIDPMLSAAEVLIHPMQDYDGAIALCDEVLEFAEAPEEIVDATLLKFDALLARGDDAEAAALLNGLPDGPFDGAMYPFLIGRAWYDAGDCRKAEPFLVDALRQEPRHPDAHYFLALVREELGDVPGATRAFLEARALDLNEPAAPWSLPREQFQREVERACAALEPDVARELEGAMVVVSDAPGLEAVVDGVDPRTPVLIDDFRAADNARVPLRVFIYQRNIERLCGGVEAVEEEILFQVTEEARHVLLAAAAAPADSALPAEATPPSDGKKPRKKSSR